MAGKESPLFYILHGDNQFDLREAIHTMRAKMAESGMGDLNINVLDGRTVHVAEVISTACLTPFLSEKRLVIVEGLLTRLAAKPSTDDDDKDKDRDKKEKKGKKKAADDATKAEMQALVEGLATLPESAWLVFAEPGPLRETHPILKLAEQDGLRGSVQSFNPPRAKWPPTSWDSGWLTKWLIARAKRYGGELSPRGAALLANMVGQDLFAADSEIFKLVTYVGEGRPIGEDDLAAVCQYVPEAGIFEIVDAIAAGKGRQALLLVKRQIDHFKAEPMQLLSMINRQFRMLIIVREVSDGGGGEAALRKIPDFEKLPPRAIQSYIEQARRFPNREAIESIHRSLLETDYAIKTGRVEDTLALDLLIVGLAG